MSTLLEEMALNQVSDKKSGPIYAPRRFDPRERLYQNLQRSKIPGLDGIRGFSALLVVGFHAVAHRLPGDHAVRMFFVVSGLLITWLLLKENEKNGAINLKLFYLRRAFRLLPPLFALLAWEAVWHEPPTTTGSAAAAAFYFANYYSAFGASLGSLVHTWSLAVEEHFYLIWPVTLAIFVNRKRFATGVLAAAGLSAAWQLCLTLWGARRYAANASEANAAAILVGCALSLTIWRNYKRLPRWLFAPALPPVCVLLIFAMAQLPYTSLTGWSFTASIPCMVIVALQAIVYEWPILENPVSRYLGQISYSIYLWQFVAIYLADKIEAAATSPRLLNSMAAVLMSIAVAALSYHLIERPVQRWLRTRLASKAGAPGTALVKAPAM